MALFLVTMRVDWPRDMDEGEARRLTEAERAYAARLQREGTWLHLWRVAGVFGNVSVFDVESHEALHEVLAGLPFFPFLTIEVTPLARHSGRIEDPPLKAT